MVYFVPWCGYKNVECCTTAGSATQIEEGGKATKFQPTAWWKLLFSSCLLWEGAVTGTMLVRTVEQWSACQLDTYWPTLNERISISSSLDAHSNPRVNGVFRGKIERVLEPTPRGKWRKKTEWTTERKARGREEEGKIEQRECEAILQTCDTLIINKLRLHA